MSPRQVLLWPLALKGLGGWSLWLSGFPARSGANPWPSKILHVLWICPFFLGAEPAGLFSLPFGTRKQWTRMGQASSESDTHRCLKEERASLSLSSKFLFQVCVTWGLLDFCPFGVYGGHKKELLWVNKQRRLKAFLYGGTVYEAASQETCFWDFVMLLQPWTTSHFWVVAVGAPQLLSLRIQRLWSQPMCMFWECPCQHTGEYGRAFLPVNVGLCV